MSTATMPRPPVPLPLGPMYGRSVCDVYGSKPIVSAAIPGTGRPRTEFMLGLELNIFEQHPLEP
eukprot:scaffold321759_cov53-Prasinocladus_malaysianus.AAC.1